MCNAKMSSIVIDLRNKHRPGKEGIIEWFADPSHVYCGRPNIYRAKVGDAYHRSLREERIASGATFQNWEELYD